MTLPIPSGETPVRLLCIVGLTIIVVALYQGGAFRHPRSIKYRRPDDGRLIKREQDL